MSIPVAKTIHKTRSYTGNMGQLKLNARQSLINSNVTSAKHGVILKSQELLASWHGLCLSSFSLSDAGAYFGSPYLHVLKDGDSGITNMFVHTAVP